MAVVELLAAAEPPSAKEFKHLNLSDCCYLMATTKDDCHFELADFISSMVVKFLGVRSLVAFGATSKSHRAALANEVDRRKACIAEVEVEVTRLRHQRNNPLNYPPTSIESFTFMVTAKEIIMEMMASMKCIRI